MSNTTRQALSGAIAGFIAFITAIVTVAAGGGPEGTVLQSVSDITSIQWLVGAGGGLLAALKDWKTLLANPRI